MAAADDILQLPTVPTGERARCPVTTPDSPTSAPSFQARPSGMDPLAGSWTEGTWDGSTAITPALGTSLGIDDEGTWELFVRWSIADEPDIVRRVTVVVDTPA